MILTSSNVFVQSEVTLITMPNLGKSVALLGMLFLLSSCAPAPAVVAPEPEASEVETVEPEVEEIAEEPAPEDAVAEPEEDYSFAEMLAIIDGQTAEDAAGYQLMLDAAAPLCPDETEESLANLTVKAKTLLAERGVEVEVLWGLGMVIMGVPEEAAGMVDCGEVMAVAMVAELEQ